MRLATTRNIAARALAVCALLALLGFYPAYLDVMHAMCDIVKGRVVRYL